MTAPDSLPNDVETLKAALIETRAKLLPEAIRRARHLKSSAFDISITARPDGTLGFLRLK